MTLFKYSGLLILTIILSLSSSPPSWAADAKFSWLPNDASDGTVGYMLHYGTSSQSYTKSIDVGSPVSVGGRIYTSVSQLVSEQTYYFTVTAYNANGDESSYTNEVAYTTSSELVPDFALRINAGGEQYTDGNGNVWGADSGYNTGNKLTTSVPINGTTDDSLFQTQRWDSATGEELKYSFNVPDGDYVVNLYFAEVYSGAFHQNGRVFDVLLEGYTAESKLDVYNEAGEYNAYKKSYNVTVIDGQLNIQFLHSIENPSIAAIEILSVTGSTTTSDSSTSPEDTVTTGSDSNTGSKFSLRINAGGGQYTDGSGDVWSADSGYNTGNTSTTADSIGDTTDDALFQTQRWDSATGEELKYSFDVPDGNYVVNLYFAEVYSGVFRSGGRVFDILLEGYNVDHNLDVYSEVGKDMALMRSYDVTVVDGQLDIEFLHGVENPSISAIEILGY